jgi:transcriptional regulator with XRE-family HTH domain
MLPTNLKRLRKNKNFKLVEFAEKTGIAKAETSKFENNGRVSKNPDNWCCFVRHLASLQMKSLATENRSEI